MGKIVNISIILLCIILAKLLLLRDESAENNVLMSMKETGYEAYIHHTTTEDGYILGIHRIMKGPKGRPENKKRPPVLLVHGLESSSLDWTHYLGKNSLPYLLFEEGYDVWLANIRGTVSSFNHTTLDPYKDAKKFWDSSVNEIGYYDLPAMIDYVLSVTKYEKLFYIGMSQGEATFLIMTSTRPEYNEKIQFAALTSPSSHLAHSDNTFYKTLAKIWPKIQKTANFLGIYQVPARDFLGSICQYIEMSRICRFLTNPIMGYADYEQISLETNTKLFQIYPTKSALKQLLHYLQMYESGIFRKFDYGTDENLKRYNSEVPPEYDLTKISAPVAYFWGENDCWSRPKDVAEIEKKLPNMVLNYRVPYKLFNHYDIFVAKDAKELIYDKIMESMQKYRMEEKNIEE